jgi:hypothetical protein
MLRGGWVVSFSYSGRFSHCFISKVSRYCSDDRYRSPWTSENLYQRYRLSREMSPVWTRKGPSGSPRSNVEYCRIRPSCLPSESSDPRDYATYHLIAPLVECCFCSYGIVIRVSWGFGMSSLSKRNLKHLFRSKFSEDTSLIRWLALLAHPPLLASLFGPPYHCYWSYPLSKFRLKNTLAT